MKPLARYFSMTSVIRLGFGLAALVAPVIAAAADSCAADARGPSPDSASRLSDYPTFCSIPSAPTDVRGAAAFKAEVVATRMAGARLVRSTAPDTFSVAGTEAFAAGARADAAPPPPITTPSQSDTAAFVKASRARATPPARPH
ncbi:MAG: hypothetical protein H0X27_05635 [Caulobacteraceae bacterium]|nr:hypothetical protein [Caulobacteraceae bacterium]